MHIQLPNCGHKACDDVNEYRIDILGRRFMLIQTGCHVEKRKVTIQGFINDWEKDERFAGFTIVLPDQTWLQNTIHTAIHQDLEAEILARIDKPNPREMVLQVRQSPSNTADCRFDPPTERLKRIAVKFPARIAVT